MSASIFYRKITKRDPTLPIMAPSSFIEMFEEAFGNMPRKLHRSDLPVLKGLAIASSKGIKEGFERLIEILDDGEDVSDELEVEVYSRW